MKRQGYNSRLDESLGAKHKGSDEVVKMANYANNFGCKTQRS